MNPVSPSLATYVFKCNEELGAACRQVKVAREKEFTDKPLAQRIAYHVCEKMQLIGKWGALASFSIGTFFSTTFLLVGAVAGVAFLVGIIARRWYETLDPREEEIIAVLSNPLGIDEKNREALPSADAFKNKRADYINGVLHVHQVYQHGDIDCLTGIEFSKVTAFINFFGGRGLWEQLKQKPHTPEVIERKNIVLERMRQVRTLYASSLLLEAIQHVAEKRLDMAKENAKKLENMQNTHFPPELAKRVTLLVGKLKEPSKEFQEQMQKAKGSKFALDDLDRAVNG